MRSRLCAAALFLLFLCAATPAGIDPTTGAIGPLNPIPSANLSWYSDDFGDGSDGTVVNTTMPLRVRNYQNYTLSANIGLAAQNYPIYVQGTFAMSAGTISCNSGAGMGSAGGTSPAAGQFPASQFGGAGGLLAGTSPAGISSFAGSGGAGGAGGSGAGGSGGAATPPTFPRTLAMWELMLGWPANSTVPAQISSGAGGGGGGGNTLQAGGGGGAGGCSVVIKARHCILSGGTIRANGGAGAAGTAVNTGGGGGGGGGQVTLICFDYVNTGTTLQALGGAGGASGGGTGVAGSSGVAGLVKVVTAS